MTARRREIHALPYTPAADRRQARYSSPWSRNVRVRRVAFLGSAVLVAAWLIGLTAAVIWLAP